MKSAVPYFDLEEANYKKCMIHAVQHTVYTILKNYNKVFQPQIKGSSGYRSMIINTDEISSTHLSKFVLLCNPWIFSLLQVKKPSVDEMRLTPVKFSPKLLMPVEIFKIKRYQQKILVLHCTVLCHTTDSITQAFYTTRRPYLERNCGILVYKHLHTLAVHLSPTRHKCMVQGEE